MSTTDLFAEVCIDRSARPLSAPLTYEVPAELNVVVGAYVLVPLQTKEATGFVVGVSETTTIAKTKPLLAVLSAPLFTESDLQLARWLSAYYRAPLADCLACLTPPGSTARLRRRLVWQGPRLLEALVAHDLTSPREAFTRLFHEAGLELSPEAARQRFGELLGSDDGFAATLRWARREGWVRDECELLPPLGKPRLVRAVELIQRESEASAATPRQQAVLDCLAARAGPVTLIDLLRFTKVSRAVVTSLVKAGRVRLCDLESRRVVAVEATGTVVHQLTEEQAQALAGIETALGSGEHHAILLHGVTASGKTEVYLRAMADTLARGRSVVALVPEIALTAQAMRIFRARFPGQVAMLHSALSLGERYDEWQRLRRGDARIALGPRSAVFAPLTNVGLVIVDEEHEGSYKQENSPRYHAREVALYRARADRAVIVLGSATPSLESSFLARRGHYQLLEMPTRVHARPLPTVEIVDLRQDLPEDEAEAEPPALGTRLRAALTAHLARAEQVVLFLNRRGFSTVIFCPACGVYERCPHCAVGLTFHQHVNRLRCHHCNFTRAPKLACPKCKRRLLGYGGPGTERVEQEVRAMLPGVETLRMDRDTTSHKGSHARLLTKFRERRAQVLIGTQMIAKGLDFPGVTLVGVVNADVGLQLPDWRAAERTFQLLVQVAGRAGRGEQPGHVIVQTYLPQHYAIAQATRGGYAAFAEEELRFRQQCGYPPYTFTANLVVTAGKNAAAERRCVRIAAALRTAANSLGRGAETILGPAPCPLAKLRGNFRWHLFVRDHSRPRLHQILTDGLAALKPSDLTGLTIDVDPQSVL